MSDGENSSSSGRGVISAEDRESIKARASEIDKRLDDVKARNKPIEPAASQRGEAMGQGLKIAVELVVGVVFGFAVGWWLDKSLGTAPWLLMLGVVLGFAAGMLNVIRTAQRMQARAEPLQKAAPSVVDEDEDGK